MRVPKKPLRSSPPQILYVDDCKPLRTVYKATLQKHGFRVCTAASGRAALKLVPARPLALVLIDQEMPGLSGDQVASKIRKRRPRLPIIMISGNYELAPQAAKVTTFLPKPVQPEKLLAVVRSFVR